MDESTSILSDIKKQLGIEETTTEFNLDIRTLINSAFFSLYQLGIGGNSPLVISNQTTWNEFSTVIPKDIVQEYVFLKTKKIFDPPQTSMVLEAYNDRIAELEFRMNVEVDNGGGYVNDG